MPKIETIIPELEKFKKRYPVDVTAILGRLNAIIKARPQSSDAVAEEKGVASFEEKIARLLLQLKELRAKARNSKDYPKKFDEVLYQTILAVAAEKPLDDIDFNREKILPEYKVVVSTRHAFDIKEIVLFIENQDPPRNPYTTLPFSQEDLDTIKKFAGNFPDLASRLNKESKNTAPGPLWVIVNPGDDGPLQAFPIQEGNNEIHIEIPVAPQIPLTREQKAYNDWTNARNLTLTSLSMLTYLKINNPLTLILTCVAAPTLYYKFCASTSITDLPKIQEVRSVLNRLLPERKAAAENKAEVFEQYINLQENLVRGISLISFLYLLMSYMDLDLNLDLNSGIYIVALSSLYYSLFPSASYLPEAKTVRSYLNKFLPGFFGGNNEQQNDLPNHQPQPHQ